MRTYIEREIDAREYELQNEQDWGSGYSEEWKQATRSDIDLLTGQLGEFDNGG
jgi:hypothetical protein